MEGPDEVKIVRIMVMVPIDSFAVVSASSKFCSLLAGWSRLYNSKACFDGTTGCIHFNDQIVGGGTSGRPLASTSLDYSPLLLGSGIIPNGNLHVENVLNVGKSTYNIRGRVQLASRVQSFKRCTWAFDRSQCTNQGRLRQSCQQRLREMRCWDGNVVATYFGNIFAPLKKCSSGKQHRELLYWPVGFCPQAKVEISYIPRNWKAYVLHQLLTASSAY